MREIAASIVVLAGAVVFAFGVATHGGYGECGIVCGMVILIVGFTFLFRAWNMPPRD